MSKITLEDLRADFEAERAAFIKKGVFRDASQGKEFGIDKLNPSIFTLSVFLNDTVKMKVDITPTYGFEFDCVWPEPLWRAANVLHQAETNGMEAAMLWKLAN